MSMATRARLSDALRSAVEASVDPAMAAADWLARDIDPGYSSAISLLTDPDVSLDTLEKAKDVYKTMRIIGETTADRRDQPPIRDRPETGVAVAARGRGRPGPAATAGRNGPLCALWISVAHAEPWDLAQRLLQA
jgi:hypothetical protein